jgi:hypothetical protein
MRARCDRGPDVPADVALSQVLVLLSSGLASKWQLAHPQVLQLLSSAAPGAARRALAALCGGSRPVADLAVALEEQLEGDQGDAEEEDEQARQLNAGRLVVGFAKARGLGSIDVGAQLMHALGRPLLALWLECCISISFQGGSHPRIALSESSLSTVTNQPNL